MSDTRSADGRVADVAPSSDSPSRPAEQPTDPAPLADFPVVGIGASAGGLEAIRELLREAPVERLAFVVVQHLSPTHESALAQILGRATDLTVETATEGTALACGHVYVIPPNVDMTIAQRTLHLAPRGPGLRLPIDLFFRSLADDLGERAIGVVLSGGGSDGTSGLEAIQAAGGLTFAQEPGSAKHDGMPRSALASGRADLCMTPQEIGQELGRLVDGAAGRARTADPEREALVARILTILRMELGHDLSEYKAATIERRIDRRVAMLRLPSLAAYVRRVESDREELTTLHHDLIISVTRFFRDAHAFEALASDVLPQLLASVPAGGAFRA